MIHDAIVVGLGINGAAVTHELARRGARVLGLDRYEPPHALGSSHGGTRIIREAYYESPVYVPLVQDAYRRWAGLERECGRTLLRTTGALTLGPPDGDVVRGALASVRAHGLAHAVLAADEAAARYPALRVPAGYTAVLEHRAGALDAEGCHAALLGAARVHGAELRFGVAVASWRAGSRGVAVATADGVHRAARLVLAAGGWLPALAPALAARLEVERQVVIWTRPVGGGVDATPITLWDIGRGGTLFYALPDLGAGVKAAIHHAGERTAADAVRRAVDAADEAAVRAQLRRFLPAADGPVLRSEVCLYTNTPDRHFLVDRLPGHDDVVVVSACSGHGFKFAPTTGALAADLVQDRRPAHDIAAFGFARFAS
jgi:sarcosine oxidase